MDPQKFARLEKLVAGMRLITKLIHERNDEIQTFINMREVDDAKALLTETDVLCTVVNAIDAVVTKELADERQNP